MHIRPISTEDGYRRVMREITTCFDNEPDPASPAGERFEVLLTLAEAYEAKHFPIEPSFLLGELGALA